MLEHTGVKVPLVVDQPFKGSILPYRCTSPKRVPFGPRLGPLPNRWVQGQEFLSPRGSWFWDGRNGCFRLYALVWGAGSGVGSSGFDAQDTQCAELKVWVGCVVCNVQNTEIGI